MKKNRQLYGLSLILFLLLVCCIYQTFCTNVVCILLSLSNVISIVASVSIECG